MYDIQIHTVYRLQACLTAKPGRSAPAGMQLLTNGKIISLHRHLL